MLKELDTKALSSLLGREIKTDISANAKQSISGKTVLVTGGGGSIGSELCRLVATLSPAKLIICDINENAVFDIHNELLGGFGRNATFEILPVIASVRDRRKMMRIFERYAPDTVFHAAAHKHVHFMQYSPDEAIKNNVCGTLNIADCCEMHGVSEMLLISTDKAIDPVGYMGTSKRLCEMIIQSRSNSKTVFAAVRFGNVLGSNGSAVPLFCRQISNKGPITVTDRRMTRYFMTAQEAARLLLEACAMAKGGEIFSLDMGKPIKIIDIAEKLVYLSGLTPYRDIDIIETGVRCGERLYEMPVTKSALKTECEGVYVMKREEFDRQSIDDAVAKLSRYAENGDIKALNDELHDIIPEFKTEF